MTASRRATDIFNTIMSRPYALLVLAQLFWAGNITAGKFAVGDIDPLLLVVGRWVGACAIILPLALPHVRRDWPAIRRNLPLLLLFGIFGYTGFNLLTYGAVHFTSAVNTSIEQASIPVMVFAGNFLFFGVRAKWLQILGVVLTIAGVALTATHGDLFKILTLDVNLGDGMALLACFFYAVYSIGLRFRPDIHWLSFLAVTFVGALAAALTALFTVGGGTPGVARMLGDTTMFGWSLILYVAIFPSIIAQLFFARGVELIGANRSSIFINLLPVFGAVLAVLILGEAFQPYHLVAAALVIGGIALSEWTARRTTVTPIE